MSLKLVLITDIDIGKEILSLQRSSVVPLPNREVQLLLIVMHGFRKRKKKNATSCGELSRGVYSLV